MAIRVKLGRYEAVSHDPLGRTHIGFFPRMTETEAWESGRGVWKLNLDKVAREAFALIVGEGVVQTVAAITGYTQHKTPSGIRTSLEGHVLPAGHPVRDGYLDRPDPVANGSRNPVSYLDLPEELPLRRRTCGCGCGAESDLDFLPGHDVRAMQAMARDRFQGSVKTMLAWITDRLTDSDHGRRPIWIVDVPAPGEGKVLVEVLTTATERLVVMTETRFWPEANLNATASLVASTVWDALTGLRIDEAADDQDSVRPVRWLIRQGPYSTYDPTGPETLTEARLQPDGGGGWVLSEGLSGLVLLPRDAAMPILEVLTDPGQALATATVLTGTERARP